MARGQDRSQRSCPRVEENGKGYKVQVSNASVKFKKSANSNVKFKLKFALLQLHRRRG